MSDLTKHFPLKGGGDIHALNGVSLTHASGETIGIVGDAIEEPLIIHDLGDKRERRAKVSELFSMVGLGTEAASRYPHEFSGGHRPWWIDDRAIPSMSSRA